MRTFARIVITASTGLALGLIATGAASGQNALGDGTVLDANTGNANGGWNLPARQNDYRLRNLVVTGNVAGGRGFRGSVGYLAEGEFRGLLGSNDLFAHRAYSAYSELSLINFGRGYSPFAAGQHSGLLEVQRSVRGAGVGEIRREQMMRFGELATLEAAIDRRMADHDQIRGITGERQPALMSILSDANGVPVNVSASGLRGVQFTVLQNDIGTIGMSAYDGARLLEDARAGRGVDAPGQPFNLDYSDLRIAGQPFTPDSADPRIDTKIPAAYDDVMERVMARYTDQVDAPEGQTPPLDDLATRLERVRAYLDGDELNEGENTDPPLIDPSLPGIDQPGETTDPDADETDEPISLDNLSVLILQHGTVVKDLGGDGEDRFNELIEDGESHLRESDFFTAERGFVRALRLKPNHPLASAGLANAQAGAGLFQAAGLTLRNLFTNHPEMIDVFYDPSLLPSSARIKGLMDQLRLRSEEGRGDIHGGLVLAYLGHQTGDRGAVDLGLKAMGDADRDDPLVPLLVRVWAADDDEDGASDQASDDALNTRGAEGDSP